MIDMIDLKSLTAILADKKEEYSARLLERLVLQKLPGDKFYIYFDKDIDSISEELQAMQRKRFDELVVQNGSDQLKLEIEDLAQLEVSKADLLDCPKRNIVTVIGQRPLKISCYFISNLRSNFKAKSQNMFDWQLIYIDAYLHSQDLTMSIALTEHDLVSLVKMLKEVT